MGILRMFALPISSQKPRFTETHKLLYPVSTDRSIEHGDLSAVGRMKFKISKPRPAPEEHYRWMVDCAVDAIVSTDANGTILTWNKAAAKMFEYTDRDVVDKPLKMLIAGDSIANLDAILATPIKSSSPIQSHELLGLKKK